MQTWTQIDNAVDEIVRLSLEQAGIAQPPVEPLLVAQALAMTAQRDADLPGRGERRTVNGRSVILIRPDPRSEREQFAIAHEIGEEVAVQMLIERLDLVDPSDAWRESLANRFAGRLLCPSDWLRAAIGECSDDLLALKKRFATASYEVIARQMLSLDVPTVITVIDNGDVHLRIGNVPHESQLLVDEQRVWIACHQQQTHFDQTHGSVRIQAWAIHESGWKREILRMTRLDE